MSLFFSKKIERETEIIFPEKKFVSNMFATFCIFLAQKRNASADAKTTPSYSLDLVIDGPKM